MQNYITAGTEQGDAEVQSTHEDNPFATTDAVLTRQQEPRGRLKHRAGKLSGVEKGGSFRFEGAGPPDSGAAPSRTTTNPDRTSVISDHISELDLKDPAFSTDGSTLE